MEKFEQQNLLRMLSNAKEPNKCPTCKGSGMLVDDETYWDKTLYQCGFCHGKGVLPDGK